MQSQTFAILLEGVLLLVCFAKNSTLSLCTTEDV